MQANDGRMLASQNGHSQTVSLLLQIGAQVNIVQNLSYILFNNESDTVTHISRQTDGNLENRGNTALSIAISNRRTDIALQLLDFGADTNVVGILGDSALTSATKGNLISVVKKIIDKGWEVNHQDGPGNSSLMTASSHGNIEIAEMLLRAGASVNISSLSDYSSLHLPPQQIQLIVDEDNDDSIKGTALDISVLQGNVDLVSPLLQYEAKIHNVYYHLFRGIILNLAREKRASANTTLFRSILKQEREIENFQQSNLQTSAKNVNKVLRGRSTTSSFSCCFPMIKTSSIVFSAPSPAHCTWPVYLG